MKILVEQIKTQVGSTDKDIFDIARARILKTRALSLVGEMFIHKRSIDARNKNDIKFVSTVCAEVEKTKPSLKNEFLQKYNIKFFENV